MSKYGRRFYRNEHGTTAQKNSFSNFYLVEIYWKPYNYNNIVNTNKTILRCVLPGECRKSGGTITESLGGYTTDSVLSIGSWY